MKQLSKVSVIHERALRGFTREGDTAVPSPAQAKIDFLNALVRAWSDFVMQKKNELGV